MEQAFAGLLDKEKVQPLLDSFCEAMGIAAAVIDLEGDVLVASRWQRICTDFHRVNEDTCALCIESDTQMANELRQGERLSLYRCRNGLTDAASPILVEGEHVANAFLGQFLIEPPDTAAFRRRAKQYGFDEDAYLHALAEVPVVPEGKLPTMLSFLTTFAEMVAGMALDRLRQEQVSRQVAQQAREILDLSTPVIRIWKGVVVAPIIGTLDTDRAQRLMEELLNTIVETRSAVALVDITGVPAIDTQIAQHLIETIGAVRLLGAHVILTGVSPAIAQTLAQLGIDLSEVATQSSLAAGLQTAFGLLDMKVTKCGHGTEE